MSTDPARKKPAKTSANVMKPAGTSGASEPSALRKSLVPKKVLPLTVDYRMNRPLPAWMREAIEANLAIESEDAKSAGTLGFMSRALVMATLPYRDPKADRYTRINGDFKLSILAGYEGGVPYGIYPRLLVNWVTTEAVRTQSPELDIGASLSEFLRDVIEIRSSGGPRGTATRVSEQMKRLFGSLISAQYSGDSVKRGFLLKNVMIAEELMMSEETANTLDGADDSSDDSALWVPQSPGEAGRWQSRLRLTDAFYRECVDNPVPIDLRAYKALRGSAMAMDVYTWLTYRMFSIRAPRAIRWETLQMQFGSSLPQDEQGRRDFKKAFIKALREVLVIYPAANVETTEQTLILNPSKPHIPMNSQRKLF